MDPVSGVASVLTLIQVAAGVAGAATELFQKVHDAPSELAAVAAHLLLIQAELEQVQQFQNTDYQRIISPETRCSLHLALSASRTTITALENAFPQPREKDGIRSKLRWALLDRSTIDKLLQRLQATESTLSTLLQLVSVYVENSKF